MAEDHMSLPFQAHSTTSKATADSMIPKAVSLREAVFSYIQANGPASDEQIQDALQMNPSTQRPRRIELVTFGRLKEVGETFTKSGRKAKLWGLV
jgi:hypothetical protein